MDFDIKLKGNDDLTRLLESINYLATSRRELELKEKRMKEERDTRVCSQSNDICTLLTSTLSFSELMMEKEMALKILLITFIVSSVISLLDLFMFLLKDERAKSKAHYMTAHVLVSISIVLGILKRFVSPGRCVECDFWRNMKHTLTELRIPLYTSSARFLNHLLTAEMLLH